MAGKMELRQQAAGTEGAAPQAGAGAEVSPGSGSVDQQQPTEGATTSELPQEVIKEIEARVREEYEGKGGHLSKLKSEYDKKLADAQRKLREQQQARQQQAQELMDKGEYRKAAALLAEQVQTLQGQTAAEAQRAEMGDWVSRVMDDLGYDLDGDEEAAQQAAEWVDKLIADPDLTWDFQQEVARGQVERQQAAALEAHKELEKLQESLPDLVRQQVTQVLTDAGFAPEPTGEGGAGKKKEDWREKPAGTLIRDGIAARMKAPIQRTQ